MDNISYHQSGPFKVSIRFCSLFFSFLSFTTQKCVQKEVICSCDKCSKEVDSTLSISPLKRIHLKLFNILSIGYCPLKLSTKLSIKVS
uniref:Uncharacterized protein n=1 Tax=Tetranychus urticae TaxID=32264 RepID=T1KLN2_TETUR